MISPFRSLAPYFNLPSKTLFTTTKMHFSKLLPLAALASFAAAQGGLEQGAVDVKVASPFDFYKGYIANGEIITIGVLPHRQRHRFPD